MHILILGGGAASLALAGLIDNSKHRVVIIEQDSPEDFAKKWHWYDNLDVAELRRLGYDYILPDSFPKQEERLVSSPSGKFTLRFKMKDNLAYEQVYRPKLLVRLQDKAREKASLRFDTRAKSLLIENDCVVGVKLQDGHEIRADLTVDCSGLTELNQKLLGDYALSDEETMTVFRGLFPREEKDAPPAADNITLQPSGISGLSRYSIDAAGKTDIFISHIGKAESDWTTQILADIIKENSTWDIPHLKSGKWGEYLVPARSPLSQFVFDGYILLGDSACMSVPFTGEGIVNALHGAKILADVINEKEAATAENFWEYQTRYYREAGKNVWRLSVLHRWLMKSPSAILEDLFSSRIFNAKDAQRVFSGQFLSLKPLDILQRSLQLLLHPRLLISIIGMFAHAIWAEECGRSIPTKYDTKKIAAWQQKINRAFEGFQ